MAEDDKILIYGDHSWLPYSRQYVDEFEEFGTVDTRDVDNVDNGARKLILKQLD